MDPGSLAQSHMPWASAVCLMEMVVLVARMVMMMVMSSINGTSVSITRTNDLRERTWCSITSSIYSVFIEPLQGIGTMVGSMNIAVKKTQTLSLTSRIVWEAQINR